MICSARALSVVLALGMAAPAISRAQAPDASASPAAMLFRIFLKDGRTLVSYGDIARVADRVVFSIPVGLIDGPAPPLHLVNIAESAVDWDQTDRYAHALRARHYAATRGESDFERLSDEVARTLSHVSQAKDPSRRLALATEAQRMLANWPATHYGYRAGDVAQLSGLLDEAVAELRVAAGLSRFDLTLVATKDATPPDVPELPAPTEQDSLEGAFQAALLTPDVAERTSLFEAIMDSLGGRAAETAWATSLRSRAAAALAAEQRIDREYRDLTTRTVAAANEQAKRADVGALEKLLRGVLVADDRLGRHRPEMTASLLATLDARLAAARRLRLERDAWTLQQERVSVYQRRIDAPLQRIRRARAGLEQIRQLAGPVPGALQPLQVRLTQALDDLRKVKPPAEAAPVHSMLVSAVQMGVRAVTDRRQAVSATDMKIAWEASSAAAGALMLFDRAQEELRALTVPPRL